MSKVSECDEDKAAWVPFWALILMQCQNSFTASIVKFMLIPLGAWLLVEGQRGVLVNYTEHVVSLLLVVPYLLFSPAAGWMADRFSKSLVIKLAGWVQLGIVVLFFESVEVGNCETLQKSVSEEFMRW